MTVTVPVAATWRLSRIEFSMQHSVTNFVVGYGEVLLQEAEGAGPEAEILRRPRLFASDPPVSKTYGTMPSATVSRQLTEEILSETIDIDGKPVTFASVMSSLAAFFEHWRIEDMTKPPPDQYTPQANAPTPVPPPPHIPEPLVVPEAPLSSPSPTPV